MTRVMKQLKEQTAFHGYHTKKRPAEVGERAASETGRRDASSAVMTAQVRKRVVVMTPEPVQPSTWNALADRRAQLRRAHGTAYVSTMQVPRTLAQTGMSASSGRMQAVPRAPLPPASSHIPVRSGRRRPHRSFFAKLLAFLAIAAIGVFGVNFALTSPAFRVQQVSVVGAQNPLVVSSIQHMGLQGQNIFLLDTAALTARIEMLPLVAAASVEKQWPNQLMVTVTERVPVLLWQTQNETYTVDRQAMVMAPASQTIGSDQLMTVVDARSQQVGVSGQPIQPGVRLDQADVAFALQVFARLPQVTGINDFTLRYDAIGSGDAGGSYVVESPGGWLAYLGSANDTNPLDNRLMELQQILALAQKQQLHLATIDVRFGLRPVYTLKNS